MRANTRGHDKKNDIGHVSALSVRSIRPSLGAADPGRASERAVVPPLRTIPLRAATPTLAGRGRIALACTKRAGATPRRPVGMFRARPALGGPLAAQVGPPDALDR